MSCVRHLIAILVILPFTAAAKQIAWDNWYKDNVYGRYRDWLVVADPGGACYMLQQHDAAPNLRVDQGGVVWLGVSGIWKRITHSTDISSFSIPVEKPVAGKHFKTVLPDATIPMLKAANTLTVSISYWSGPTLREDYSLNGFTRGHEAMGRCISGRQ